MSIAGLVAYIAAGICMFFVGRTLGYREAVQDFAGGYQVTIRVRPRDDDEEDEDDAEPE